MENAQQQPITVYDPLKDQATTQDIRNHFGLLQMLVKNLQRRVLDLEERLEQQENPSQ